MTQLLIFPDVEALAVQALNADFVTRMPGVKWSTKVPNPRPDKFGRLMRSGGPRETLITENASLIVEGWAAQEADAIAILNLARAILFEQDGTLFGVTETGGPTNLPDPTTSQVRYTALLGVRVRGTVTA
jgi:hypothetical protein